MLAQRFNLGKSRQSALDFAVNTVYVMLINAICVTPVIIIASSIIQMTGNHFVLYSWLFFATAKLCWVIFENATPPSFFAKKAPLEQGQLRTAIEHLVKREDFPFREIYVMDGRNSTIPAWIYGTPWSRNFVLRDTLLRQVNSQEITALTVHELGHWKLGHKYMTLAISQVSTLL
jgi:STE24 endopeptidase